MVAYRRPITKFSIDHLLNFSPCLDLTHHAHVHASPPMFPIFRCWLVRSLEPFDSELFDRNRVAS
jgi:hypothetical protein